ncbi:hypothetical protein B296_00043264 [Ensete ventricosum]|uniref:Uncharacterized protein n=1 Tax=Ensete ventricosum TaxID=4639 RepID=A0A426XSA4_ENSVE|nr:hypothetical protein B296_00043264 [Ensete ventricosum]
MALSPLLYRCAASPRRPPTVAIAAFLVAAISPFLLCHIAALAAPHAAAPPVLVVPSSATSLNPSSRRHCCCCHLHQQHLAARFLTPLPISSPASSSHLVVALVAATLMTSS